MASTIKGLSIRHKILLLTIIPIVTTSTILGTLVFASGSRAVNDLARQLGSKSANSIEDQVNNFLLTHHLYLTTQAATIAGGQLNLSNQQNVKNYLWQQIKAQNEVNLLFYFEENNAEFTLVERESNGQFVAKYKNATTGAFRRVYNLDDQGNLSPQAIRDESYPNPRNRRWYEVVTQEQKPTWTPVYTYAGEPRLGITAVAPIYNNTTGQIRSILAIDVTLDHIDDFLNHLEISPRGEAFVIERSDGILVGSSTNEPLVINNEPVLAANSEEPTVAAAAQFILEKFQSFDQVKNGQFSFKLNNQDQLVVVKVLQNEVGLDWLLVVVIPRLDFMNNIYSLTIKTVLVGVFTAIAITFAASTIAHKISSPIQKLTQASEKIAEGDLNQTVEIKQQDELGILAASFNQMTRQLGNLIKKEVELESVQKQMEIGRQIQHDFLPEAVPVVEGWETACVFQPAYEVAGDFYDAFLINEDQHLCFIIADVCEKGIGAALFMSLFRSLLRGTTVQHQDSPEKALQQSGKITGFGIMKLWGYFLSLLRLPPREIHWAICARIKGNANFHSY